MMPTGCMRCRTFTPLMQLGVLWLCPPCFAQGITPDCGAFQHPWQGGETGWVCVRCARVLGSTSVQPAAVPEDTHDLYQNYR
jgi:hypothetical protein